METSVTSLSAAGIIGFHSTLKKKVTECVTWVCPCPYPPLSRFPASKLFDSQQQEGDTMAKTTQHDLRIPTAGRVPLSTAGWEGSGFGLHLAEIFAWNFLISDYLCDDS